MIFLNIIDNSIYDEDIILSWIEIVRKATKDQKGFIDLFWRERLAFAKLIPLDNPRIINDIKNDIKNLENL